MKFAAIYVRISNKSQEMRSQEGDLKRWAAAQDHEVKWYRDTATGTKMERPAMDRLLADVAAGNVSRIVVWRLDRLGRTASGLTKLFDDLIARKVGLESLKDKLDLSTPGGRLTANVLASVGAFETEVRRKRQAAGIAAALAAGESWGGRTAGSRNRDVAQKQSSVRALHRSGKSISEIARVTSLSRPTVYSLLGK